MSFDARRSLRLARARLRAHASAVLLAAAAATIAFLVSTALFGAERAFFAPVAAVVSVGIAAGQRVRRAAELTAGVTIGLTAADLLTRFIGTGPLQLGVVVLFAMAAAVAIGASPLMANQAAVAGILVIALTPTTDLWIRLVNAFLGGGVALLLNAIFGPDPVEAAHRVAHDVVDDFVATLHRISSALEDGSLHAAEQALGQAQRAARRVAELDQSLAAAREVDALARPRRHQMRTLDPLVLLRARLDVISVTMRSLARAVATAVRHGQPVEPRLVEAVEDLASALVELCRWAGGEAGADEVRDQALHAALTATQALRASPRPTVNVLVGQVRSATVDVLCATGLDQRRAVALLEEVAGPADTP
jgi:uncharacterized membrane protein YgaE (UPF0421/DUF939 family)